MNVLTLILQNNECNNRTLSNHIWACFCPGFHVNNVTKSIVCDAFRACHEEIDTVTCVTS